MFKESIINFNPAPLNIISVTDAVIEGSEEKTIIRDGIRIHLVNNDITISDFSNSFLIRLPELVLLDAKCFGSTVMFSTETTVYKFHLDTAHLDLFATGYDIKRFTCPDENTFIIYSDEFYMIEFDGTNKKLTELRDNSYIGKIAQYVSTPAKLFRRKQDVLALESNEHEFYYLTSDSLNIYNLASRATRSVMVLIEDGKIFLFDDYIMVYTGYEFVLVKDQVLKRIGAKIDLLDFMVIPKNDSIKEQVWQIYALYGNQIEYLDFTMDDDSGWNAVYKSEKDYDVQIERDGELIRDLDEKYLEFIFSNSIAQISEYTDTLAVEQMRLHVLNYVAKTISKGDYNVSLSESWHNFTSRLIDHERYSLNSCTLSYDSKRKTVIVAKLGDRVGIITNVDYIDLLKPEMEKHLLFGPIDEKLDKIRDSLKHLADLTRLIELNPFIEHSLFYTSIAQMNTLEEFAEQMYPDDQEFKQTILVGYTKISDFENTLSALISIFQTPDYKSTSTPNLDLFEAKIISELARNMINDRYTFIKKVYLILMPLIALGKKLPKNLVALWQSLTVCYHRLQWLCEQQITKNKQISSISNLDLEEQYESLLEYFVHKHVEAEWNHQSFSIQYINASYAVLSTLGWSRAYPLGSLNEAQSVVIWANKFLDYTASYALYELMLTLPSPSPATCFTKAKLYLQMHDFYNARVNFENASCGNNVQPNKYTDLGLVVPSNILQGGVSLYYLHVMQICNEYHPDLSIHFGKLALRTAMNGVNEVDYLLRLQKSIFSCAIQAGDFKSAYEIVISIQDKDIQRDILRALITELCDAQELELLVGGFSFAGLNTEVENTLLFKARTEVASPHQKTTYYKIAYAYFVYRGDFRNAALVMYHQAHKLTKIMWNERFVGEMAHVCTIMTQCYLVAYNALSLLEGEYAYLLSEEKFNAGYSNDVQDPTDINPTFTPTILNALELKKLYHLSLAKLVLFPTVPHFSQTFQLPLALDVYSVYCSQKNYKAAKQTAELFNLDYDKLIVMAVQVILTIYSGKACPVQGEFELNAKTPLQKAWQSLQKLLSDFDSPSNSFKYHQIAIKTFLSHKPELALPTWIFDPFKSDLCDILIRIYLQHNRLSDAANLSISHLQEISFQTGNAHFSKWISMVTIEHLIKCLEKGNRPEKIRLDNVLRTYFNETLVQSRAPSPFTLFSGAQFLKHELPIRLAHRVVELENLPHDFSKMPSVNIVKDWYTQSFKELQEFDDSKFGISEKYYKNLNYSYYHNNIKMEGIEDVVQDAISNAQNICQDYYGLFSPPVVKIVGVGNKIRGNFMYVPSHLHHMLFELLKNSMRAVVERFGQDEDDYPEIKVVIAEGKEDITIKVSDEEKPILEDGGGDFKAPLAGYGYGLPLSRLYARYFGGDLRLISMEGYGTDAYLHLSRLSDSNEPLP
ncbi:hypothetical protein HK103_001690 [Boothiomyces macroporosus]|uniref:Protein-serine/threonine kinase n=1 Tax=Boothiomyces macroporosus TaxID=261099 RepID=A0AAD5Y502_9FUNG|nr:hypothetical protein HK103_001690 [Boothiomyces macroporosus]